ncbi:MAG TPA: ribosome silencing factor [Atribacteraceae bacterium]|nr:ribosome silencing factor [Atribacteraceae bacterium]
MTAKEKIQRILEAAESKKAYDFTLLDLREMFPLADYWVVMSAPSVIQTKAIAEAVQTKMKAENLLPHHREGLESGEWILLDYGDILVHIFRQEEREFYQLEKIWRKAAILYLQRENIDRLDQIG